MNLFYLECFLALSQSLNFTQTASEMYITQPTLSRNIASLEQEIGVQLLVRNTKSVKLTAAGKSFAADCAAILRQYNNSLENARQARDGITGALTLGIQQDTFEPFVVDVVRKFHAEYPNIRLQIKPLSISNLLNGLSSGKLDFMIGASTSEQDQFSQLLLSERQECAVLPVDHPLAGERSLRMEQLNGESFVVISSAASVSGHYLLIKNANKAGFAPDIVATADCVPAVMMLVACGTGISVLYQDLAVHSQGRVKFVPLEEVDPFKRWLMWDKENPNPALPAMIHCAAEYAASGVAPCHE